jgi:hypothetical protein
MRAGSNVELHPKVRYVNHKVMPVETPEGAGAVDRRAIDKARFTMMSGKPHGEPITLRGSYVY